MNETTRSRQALQEHIAGLESRVRRRILGKLRAIGRSAYDIDDVLSSARRRIDAALLSGRIRATCDDELDSFIFGVAERVALNAVRRERRKVGRLWQAAILHQHVAQTQSHTLDIHALQDALARLNSNDRGMIEMWARGLTHSRIAEEIGIGFEAYRSRWRRLRSQVREIIADPYQG